MKFSCEIFLVGVVVCIWYPQISQVGANVYSCSGKCDTFDFHAPCQCNSQCVGHNDCCHDYQAVCLGATCAEICGLNLDSTAPCQCNSHCTRFNDCCQDYYSLCEGGGQEAGSDEPETPVCMSTADVSELMWLNDVNRFSGEEIRVNYQTRIPFSFAATDKSSEKLFTSVNTAKLWSGTYELFLALMDNYNPNRGQADANADEYQREEDSFLTAILDTPVLQILLEYAQCRGWVNSVTSFRQRLVTAWFDKYPRSSSSNIKDSSGFEHVMVGEYKSSTEVSGFHSWIAFYEYEAAGNLNYYGYVAKNNPDIVGATFVWNNRIKPLGSFIIGVSPELDLALYSLAFWNAPNELTDVSLGGNSVQIRTYSIDGHVASAFVES